MRTALLCTLALSAVAEAGVRLDAQTIDPQGTSGEQRMELQGNKVRIDRFTQEGTGSGGVNRIPGGTMIFDGTQMFTIDHRNKTYLVIDPAQLKAQMEQVKQMEANLPPEARAKLEKAMDTAEDPGKVTFKKGTGGNSVAGFACSNYTQSRDGVERATVCIASWKSGPVKKEDLGGLVKIAETMGAAAASNKAMLINPDNWPGFPLSSQTNDGHSLRVKSATRATIPDNEFQPPTDYTRKAMPSFDRGATP